VPAGAGAGFCRPPGRWRTTVNSLQPGFRPLLMLPRGLGGHFGFGFYRRFGPAALDLSRLPDLDPAGAHAVAFPFVVRSLTPSLSSISRACARPQLCWALTRGRCSTTSTCRWSGGRFSCGLCFAFSISLGEFGATALVARPEYPTIPVMILTVFYPSRARSTTTRPGAEQHLEPDHRGRNAGDRALPDREYRRV